MITHRRGWGGGGSVFYYRNRAQKSQTYFLFTRGFFIDQSKRSMKTHSWLNRLIKPNFEIPRGKKNFKLKQNRQLSVDPSFKTFFFFGRRLDTQRCSFRMVRVIWWHFFGSAVGVRTIPPLREIERYIYMLLWGSWLRSEMGTTWFIVAAVCGGFFGRSSCTFTVGTVSTVDYCTILPSYWSTCGVCTSINSSWLCLCGPTFFFLFLR